MREGEVMGLIGGPVADTILRRFGESNTACAGAGYKDKEKIEILLGPGVWSELAGRTVIDFGCGEGEEAIKIAQRGAAHVMGIDIRERVLAIAEQRVANLGLQNISFAPIPTEKPMSALASTLSNTFAPLRRF